MRLLLAAAALLMVAPVQAEVVHLTTPVDLATVDPVVGPALDQDPTGVASAAYDTGRQTVHDLNNNCLGHEVPSNRPTDLRFENGGMWASVNTDSAPDVGSPFQDGSEDPIMVGVGMSYGKCPLSSSPFEVCVAVYGVIRPMLREGLSNDPVPDIAYVGPAPQARIEQAMQHLRETGGVTVIPGGEYLRNAEERLAQDICKDLQVSRDPVTVSLPDDQVVLHVLPR